jgi:hypothetical protein
MDAVLTSFLLHFHKILSECSKANGIRLLGHGERIEYMGNICKYSRKINLKEGEDL